MDIWVRINEIRNVQHPLRDIDATHIGELEDSFHKHSLNYSRGLPSVTALHPVAEPFDPFDLLNCTEGRSVVLCDDCQVRIMHRSHCLNLMTYLC